MDQITQSSVGTTNGARPLFRVPVAREKSIAPAALGLKADSLTTARADADAAHALERRAATPGDMQANLSALLAAGVVPELGGFKSAGVSNGSHRRAHARAAARSEQHALNDIPRSLAVSTGLKFDPTRAQRAQLAHINSGVHSHGAHAKHVAAHGAEVVHQSGRKAVATDAPHPAMRAMRGQAATSTGMRRTAAVDAVPKHLRGAPTVTPFTANQPFTQSTYRIALASGA